MMKTIRSSSGFSLIELMIVIVVLAILVTLATPSFIDLIDRNRLKGQLEGVVELLELAKTEGMKRTNTTAGSSLVTVTINKGGGDKLWSITVIHDRELGRVVGASDVELVSGLDKDEKVVLTYSFRGVVSGAGAVDTDFILRSPRGRQLKFKVNAIGRIMVCSPGGDMWGYVPC